MINQSIVIFWDGHIVALVCAQLLPIHTLKMACVVWEVIKLLVYLLIIDYRFFTAQINIVLPSNEFCLKCDFRTLRKISRLLKRNNGYPSPLGWGGEGRPPTLAAPTMCRPKPKRPAAPLLGLKFHAESESGVYFGIRSRSNELAGMDPSQNSQKIYKFVKN